MRPLPWLALLLCCALPATAPLAEAQQAVEELPWYEIELIIFTRDVRPDSLDEAWPDNPGSPDFEHARPLQTDPSDRSQPAEAAAGEDIDGPGSGANPDRPPVAPPDLADDNSRPARAGQILTPDTLAPPESPAPAGQPPEPYARLPEEALRLKTEFKRLQQSRDLRPEIHLAWRQPVTRQQQAQWLYLRAPDPAIQAEKTHDAEESPATAHTTESGIPGGLEPIAAIAPEPPSLEGTIRISVGRYLHVELDLLRRIKTTEPYAIEYGAPFADDYAVQSRPYKIYRMQAHRRMRSGELHYIDHPLMGVLIKITPYEPPPAGAPVPPETTALPHPAEAEKTDTDGTEEAPHAAAAAEEAPASAPEPGRTRSTIAIPARPAE